MRTAVAMVALVLVPLLAGCTDGDGDKDPAPPSIDFTPGVTAAGLTEGGFYAFEHGGGALVFTLDGAGDASFDLYDGQDRRLGSVGFSSDPARNSLHRIEGVEPGDLVLRVQTLNGTLKVDSGGAPVARFQPLGRSVERVMLYTVAGRPLDPLGPTFVPTDGAVDETVQVAFQRPPADLRLLATGPWRALDVQVASDRGEVLRIDPTYGSQSNFGGPGQGLVLSVVPSTLTLENLRDGELTAHVTADDLGGAVVLESESYSRAPLPTAPAASGDEPTFKYGALERGASAFSVSPDAKRLLLWQERATEGDAAVAILDAHDVRVATVLVPSTGFVEVPVAAGGEYVAVLLAGNASLGADQAPADFELRALEVQSTVVPSAYAGGPDDLYAIATEDLELPTAFAFETADLPSNQGSVDSGGFSLPIFCDQGRFLRIDQGGEAVLAWPEPAVQQPDLAPLRAAALALGTGSFTVTHDGFGDDGCGRPAVAILSYVRSI